MVDEREQDRNIKELANAVIKLRDQQEELAEQTWRASHEASAAKQYVSNHLDQRLKLREGGFGTEMTVYPEDAGKVPERYSDKKFWYMSLPVTHASLFFKRIMRWASSYVVTPDASVESTRMALSEAHRDRELLNIIRIQRKVDKVKRAVENAIRKNRNEIVEVVGGLKPENEVAAQVLQQHFIETGLCSKVIITTDYEKIYLHIDIVY